MFDSIFFLFGNLQVYYYMFIFLQSNVILLRSSTRLTHFARKYFSQSRDRNCESWRDRANNQDCLLFHRCSARPVIFSCFVRRLEGGQRCCPARSDNCRSYIPPLSLFFFVEDDTIPRSIYFADPSSSPRSCYGNNI